MIKHGPFAVMAGAPWNVLDSRGARIALCGGDSNSDWERCGPPIAAAITKALNEHDALEEVMHWAQAVLTAMNVGDVAKGSPLHLKLREVMIAFRDKTRPPEDDAPDVSSPVEDGELDQDGRVIDNSSDPA